MLTLRRVVIGLLLTLIGVAPLVAAGVSSTLAILRLQPAVFVNQGPEPASINWMGDAPKPQPGSPSNSTPQLPAVITQAKSPSLLQFFFDVLFDAWTGYPPRVGVDWMGDAPKPRPRG